MPPKAIIKEIKLDIWYSFIYYKDLQTNKSLFFSLESQHEKGFKRPHTDL